MNDFNFSTKIEQIDQAALLITLGFELKEVKVVNHIDMNTNSHKPRKINASWTFSKFSPFIKELGSSYSVLQKFVFPQKGDTNISLLNRCKIASHNYQVLKSVIIDGKPLQQINAGDYVILKNANGKEIPKSPSIINQNYNYTFALIAIATALGCEISRYEVFNNQMFVVMEQNKDGLNIQMIKDIYNNFNPQSDDFTVLPTLIAMFINREHLIKEIHEQKKAVMITRGDRIVMFDKDVSDELKSKSLSFINQ